MNAFDAMLTARTMEEPPTVRLVFVMLAGRIGSHDRAWPAIATLCADTGIGETAVRSALRRLVAAGHIDVSPRHGMTSLWTIGPRHTPSPREGVTPSPGEPHPLASHQSPPRQANPKLDKKIDKEVGATTGPSAMRPVAALNGNGNGNGPAPGESWGEYRERGGQ